MSQIGRNLTDAVDGLLKCKRRLIHDRDLFTSEFSEGARRDWRASVKLPPRSPNLNAHVERFVCGQSRGRDWSVSSYSEKGQF